MIVRTWHGCVPLKHAEGFAKHLEKTGVEHSKNVQGNRGAFIRRETQGNWEHFSSPLTGRSWKQLSYSQVKTIMWL